MHPQLDIVTPSDRLPDAVDTVVIGGGIAGVTAALELVERGQSVCVVEKGEIAAEQSCRNWGWVRRMGREPADLPLSMLSLEIWAGMGERIGAETGFCRPGIVYAAETERSVEGLKVHHANAQAAGLNTKLLTPEAFAALMPGHRTPVLAALYTEDDGRAEPAIAVPAMARALKARGGHVLTNCAARGIETEGGRVAGVITERGAVRCSAAVLAGGAWSRLFAGNVGIGIPALTVRSTAMRTKPVENGPTIALGDDRIGVRARQDGGLTLAYRGGALAQITPDGILLFHRFAAKAIANRQDFRFELGAEFLKSLRRPRQWSPEEESPFERERILNPRPWAKSLERARRELVRRFPALTAFEEADRWAGMIDITPDFVPIISESPLPGLVISTGYSGYGFGLGPGAGRLTADLVTGDTPCVDPAPFRLSRFGRVWSPKGKRGLRPAAVGMREAA